MRGSCNSICDISTPSKRGKDSFDEKISSMLVSMIAEKFVPGLNEGVRRMKRINGSRGIGG